ncbi:MAG TPA: hypothetical protein VK717_05515 [Opitutaceae bacterium]|nr:hypothetical protein [Opitutaceae bacterium]
MKIAAYVRILGQAGLVLAGALGLAVMAGCVVEAPPPETTYDAAVPDDYVYYPAYEVYYSSVRHQYVYRDGSRWVTRPTPPPRVAVNVLHASPSVHMNFHDHPSTHHASVVHDYPRNWTPPPAAPARGQPNPRDGHDNGNTQPVLVPPQPGLPR